MNVCMFIYEYMNKSHRRVQMCFNTRALSLHQNCSKAVFNKILPKLCRSRAKLHIVAGGVKYFFISQHSEVKILQLADTCKFG